MLISFVVTFSVFSKIYTQFNRLFFVESSSLAAQIQTDNVCRFSKASERLIEDTVRVAGSSGGLALTYPVTIQKQ